MMNHKRTPLPPEPEDGVVLPRKIHLVPLDNIAGFDVRPGPVSYTHLTLPTKRT